MHNAIKALLAVLLAGAAILVGSVLAVLFYFTGMYQVYFPIVAVLLAALTVLATLRLFLGKRRIWRFLFPGVVAFAALAFGGTYAYDSWKNSLPVLNADINLYEYQPFQDSVKLAMLHEDSTLRFTQLDGLPKIDGATALYPVYAAFVQAVYPDLPDEEAYSIYSDASYAACNSTEYAFQRLVNGEVDVIFALAPSDEQIAMAKNAGHEFALTPIGKEAFVFFVHADNPVGNLSVEQIKGIYSGQITSWRDVGGNNQPIIAYQRRKNSGSQTALEQLMAGTPLMDAPSTTVNTMMGIIDQTADYQNRGNAIGYSFRFFATEMASNDQIRLLAMDGTAPFTGSITDGSYPLVSELYAITLEDPSDNTRRSINWALSEQGQQLVAQTGYVPIQQ